LRNDSFYNQFMRYKDRYLRNSFVSLLTFSLLFNNIFVDKLSRLYLKNDYDFTIKSVQKLVIKYFTNKYEQYIYIYICLIIIFIWLMRKIILRNPWSLSKIDKWLLTKLCIRRGKISDSARKFKNRIIFLY